jgi:hypothetical protein
MQVSNNCISNLCLISFVSSFNWPALARIPFFPAFLSTNYIFNSKNK